MGFGIYLINMSILINKNTKIIVQGITGSEGSFHTQRMLEFGSNIAAGVTPNKGGQEIFEIKVFNNVSEAASATGADASVIFVPAKFAKSAIFEAIDAQIKLIVAITEGIPTQDMIEVIQKLKGSKSRLIGPNCPGIANPNESKMGIIPNTIFKKGNTAIISRSGTLTYEIIAELTRAGIGQSTCIGIGGDPILGSTFIELLPDLENDPETNAIVLVGEIGGSDEECAAEYIKSKMKKPVIAFISGRTAPPGKRMGHAGAIISGNKGTAQSKIKAFQNANVPIAETILEIPVLIKKLTAHS